MAAIFPTRAAYCDQSILNQIENREDIPQWVACDARWYHSQIQYLSNSMLATFRDRVEDFAGIYVDRSVKAPDTKAMYEGRIRHMALLEPDVFEAQVVDVPPEALTRHKITEKEKADWKEAGNKIKDLRGKVNPNGQRRGKDWDQFEASHTQRLAIVNLWPIFLKAGERKQINAQRDAVLKQFGPIFEAPGAVETSIFWRCPWTGAYLRCRPDKVIDLGDRWLAIDFKTAQSTVIGKLYYHCRDFGYPYQAAHYSHGLMTVTDGKPVDFMLICCENSAPFCPRAIRYKPRTLRAALDRNLRDIERIQERMRSKSWIDETRMEVTEFEIREEFFNTDLREWD